MTYFINWKYKQEKDFYHCTYCPTEDSKDHRIAELERNGLEYEIEVINHEEK